MGYIPVTPFRRAIKAAVTKYDQRQESTPAPQISDKWKILRELSTARRTYGLSDRDLTVLQTLLSFHRATNLDLQDDLVVHPSNASICARLNGMPCSTMRRHIARLVSTGILTRRDSPNGKRYVRRYAGERIAYGFDLAPFASRADEFANAAHAVREAEEHTRHLRETVSLKRRDVAHLAEQGHVERPNLPIWDQLADLSILTSRQLRRKLTDAELREIEATLDEALERAGSLSKAEEMSTRSAENEQDHLNTNKELDTEAPAEISLAQVTHSCPEVQVYTEEGIITWEDLFNISSWIRPMIGVREETWQAAIKSMGMKNAAVAVAAILQRFDEIRSPEQYLKQLTFEAREGRFSVERLLNSLGSPRSSQL